MKKINNTLAIAAFVAVSSFFAQKANAQTTMSFASAPEFAELNIDDDFAELNIDDEFAELNIDDEFAELNIDDEETELFNGENTAQLAGIRGRFASVDNTQNKQVKQILTGVNKDVKFSLWR